MRSTSSIKWGWQAWLRLGLGLGAIVAAISVLGWGGATRAVGAVPSLCLFHRLTGLECPGCGMTRAFARLLQGDWRGAWAYNPWSLPLLALMILGAVAPADAIGRAMRSRTATRLGWLLLAWILAWWLLTRILPHL